MRCRHRILFAPLISVAASGAHAQVDERAVRYIAQAIEGHGGLVRIAALTALRIHGRGTSDQGAIAQGPSPDRLSSVSIDEWLTIDRTSERASHEYRMARNDGSLRWRRFSYEGSDRVVLQFGSTFVSRRPDTSAPRIRRELMRAVPHLLLLEAHENLRALRALADIVISGRRHMGAPRRLVAAARPSSVALGQPVHRHSAPQHQFPTDLVRIKAGAYLVR